MQHEIRGSLDLLGPGGLLCEEGWARKPYWRYDRSKIKAPWYRVKEWDYFAILSQDGRFGLTLTMSDLGYAGLFALCFLDFKAGYFRQVDSLRPLTMGRIGFSPDSDTGRVQFKDAKLKLDFHYAPGRRTLNFTAPTLADAEGNTGLVGQIDLEQPEDLESMNIATSWAENRSAFYYNRKINCMPASGGFRLGAKDYSFAPTKDFGTLDWGRGHWTYRNRWYWGSASGYVGDAPLGWNIGYGFSDRSPASENVIFYRGRAHKLEDVQFHFDTRDYMKPWVFTSSDGRFEMDFKPLVDRNSKTELLVIKSEQHQVFGEFTGALVLDDGTRLVVDRLLGFAEDVLNYW